MDKNPCIECQYFVIFDPYNDPCDNRGTETNRHEMGSCSLLAYLGYIQNTRSEEDIFYPTTNCRQFERDLPDIIVEFQNKLDTIYRTPKKQTDP